MRKQAFIIVLMPKKRFSWVTKYMVLFKEGNVALNNREVSAFKLSL